MAIGVLPSVGQTAKVNTTDAFIDVTMPSGVAIGTVLVATVVAQGGDATTMPVHADWTLAVDNRTTGQPRMWTAYRVATGTEPGTYRFVLALATHLASGSIVAFTGVDTATPMDVAGATNVTSATGATVTTIIAPSLTMVTAGSWLITGAGVASGSITLTHPGGMTAIVEVGGQRQELAYEERAASGATGTRSFTLSSAGNVTTWSIALRAGPSGRIFTAGAESGTLSELTASTGNMTASTVRPHRGSYSYRSDIGAPSVAAFGWKSFTGVVGTTYYFRHYYYITSYHPAAFGTMFLSRIRTPALVNLLSILTSATGIISIRNDVANANVVSSSAGALPLNTWTLIEAGLCINAATNDDYVELRINGVSIGSNSILDMGTVAPGRWEIGQISLNGGLNYTYFFDAVALNASTGLTDNSWPGLITPGQAVRPVADVADGTWTDQLGGVSLFAAIDEATSSDADFIESALLTTTADVSEVALAPITDPNTFADHIVRYRYGKNFAGGDRVDLTVSLRQGTATEIASWTHTDIAASPITVDQTLTAAQADAVTDYNDLRLRFSAFKV